MHPSVERGDNICMLKVIRRLIKVIHQPDWVLRSLIVILLSHHNACLSKQDFPGIDVFVAAVAVRHLWLDLTTDDTNTCRGVVWSLVLVYILVLFTVTERLILTKPPPTKPLWISLFCNMDLHYRSTWCCATMLRTICSHATRHTQLLHHHIDICSWPLTHGWWGCCMSQ